MSSTILSVLNPRSGIEDFSFEILSNDEIKLICDELKEQQFHWQNLSIDNRIYVLQQWKLAIIKNRDAIVNALSVDTGRKWETLLEVDLIGNSIDRWCKIAKDFFEVPTQKTTSIPFINLQQDLKTQGLVGIISPWNFPLLLSLIDTIPALLAGCSVVVKPSEITPRFVGPLQNTIDEVPALSKVLKYINGDGNIGATLIKHCDLICFTGSTATGKKVYEAASKNMIPVFLELGGKDPAIVLETSNIDNAASSILWGSTANAGQSCLSIERVYVHENIFKPFCDSIVQKSKNISLTYPDIEKGQIAPIIFHKQVTIINEHLQDAIDKGAIILSGESKCLELGGGYYLPPTILINVNHTMKVMQEETFGPIIPIMSFKTNDEAIALANDTIYGLSGAVFAATNEEAMQVGKHIIGGAISINDSALTAIVHEGEKNSFKLSGIGGTRMGPNAIKRFMKQKVFIIKNKEINSPWWY